MSEKGREADELPYPVAGEIQDMPALNGPLNLRDLGDQVVAKEHATVAHA